MHDQSNVAFNTCEGFESDCWVMDSGASTHMCKDNDVFEEYKEVQHARALYQARKAM